jgi:hypothetical protein
MDSINLGSIKHIAILQCRGHSTKALQMEMAKNTEEAEMIIIAIHIAGSLGRAIPILLSINETNKAEHKLYLNLVIIVIKDVISCVETDRYNSNFTLSFPEKKRMAKLVAEYKHRDILFRFLDNVCMFLFLLEKNKEEALSNLYELIDYLNEKIGI